MGVEKEAIPLEGFAIARKVKQEARNTPIHVIEMSIKDRADIQSAQSYVCEVVAILPSMAIPTWGSGGSDGRLDE
jgi:hypothetical protein